MKKIKEKRVPLLNDSRQEYQQYARTSRKSGLTGYAYLQVLVGLRRKMLDARRSEQLSRHGERDDVRNVRGKVTVVRLVTMSDQERAYRNRGQQLNSRECRRRRGEL